ncbi:TPA: TIGR04255 family protein [Legionella pneumophila]|nr:TIGR04255 family protein [Legionella pneumophila]
MSLKLEELIIINDYLEYMQITDNSMIKRRYKNPSIQEAIFEAKFKHIDFDYATLGQIFDLLKENYPNKQDIKHIPILVDRAGNLSSVPSSLQVQAPQMRAIKLDNSELIQIGPGIVTANKLKYVSWEDFTAAISIALQSYISIVRPEISTRIATRYINSFYIPESTVNISEYFNLSLQIPNNLSDVQAFNLTLLNKFKVAEYDSEFEIRTKFLSDTLREGEIGNRFILDMDCYITHNVAPIIDKMILIARKAHDLLEDVFESIITDKTRLLMEVINE